jgi:hypothetical protein
LGPMCWMEKLATISKTLILMVVDMVWMIVLRRRW